MKSGSGAIIKSDTSSQNVEKDEEAPHLQRERELNLSAVSRAELTYGVRGLDGPAADVVADAVRRAYWSAHRDEEGWGDSVIPVFLLFVVAVVANWSKIVDSKDFANYPALGYAAIVVVLWGLVSFSRLVTTRFDRISRSLAKSFRFLFLGSVIFLGLWEGWRPKITYAIERANLPDDAPFAEVLARADVAVFYAVRAYAAVIVLGALLRLTSWMVGRASQREPKDVVESSRLLLEVQRLVVLSHRLLEDEDEKADGPEFRQYLVRVERGELIHSLDRIARLAEGDWRKSLRVGDRDSDRAVGRLAAGIAEAARRWKPIAATGGRSEEMHEAFVAGLVAGSQGRWGRLAVDVSEREFFTRKLMRVSRHLIAVAIFGSAILMVTMRPFEWLEHSISAPLNSILILAALAISLAIDPTVIGRMARGLRLGQSIRESADLRSP